MDEADSPFPGQEARTRERARKRDALLRAAVRMFNEKGFQATSLEEVAARLGVTKPTIYHYFGNKENILLECVERGMRELSGAVASANSSNTANGLERLRTFLIRYAEINMEDFGRCVVRTPDEALSHDGQRRFRALKSEIDQAMRAMIRDGVEDGSITPVDVRMAAFALAGALNGPAHWFDPRGPSTSSEIAQSLVAILMSGLSPR